MYGTIFNILNDIANNSRNNNYNDNATDENSIEYKKYRLNHLKNKISEMEKDKLEMEKLQEEINEMEQERANRRTEFGTFTKEGHTYLGIEISRKKAETMVENLKKVLTDNPTQNRFRINIPL